MYRVLYSSLARQQIADQVAYLREEGTSDQRIEAWFEGLFDRVDDLSQYPLRHAAAESYSQAVGRPIRRMVYGQYLLFYHVDEGRMLVEVVAFHHGARPEKKP